MEPVAPGTSTTRGSAGSPSATTASSPLGARNVEKVAPTGATDQSMSGRTASRRAASSSPPESPGRRSPIDMHSR